MLAWCGGAIRMRSLMVLVNGRLRAGSVSAEGREITIGVMAGHRGGRDRAARRAAAQHGCHRDAGQHLAGGGAAGFLPFLCARPDLMLRLMALLCDRLRKASKAFEDVALAPLSARLARLLLGLAEEHGVPGEGGTRIRLKLSQKDMSARWRPPASG